MKINFYAMIFSVLITSCSNTMVLKRIPFNQNIQNIDIPEQDSISQNIFFSGGINNSQEYKYDTNSLTIFPFDSLIYFKYNYMKKYGVAQITPFIYDLTKSPFSLNLFYGTNFNSDELHKINKYISEKLFVYEKLKYLQYPFIITQNSFSYDENKFCKNNLVEFSYNLSMKGLPNVYHTGSSGNLFIDLTIVVPYSLYKTTQLDPNIIENYVCVESFPKNTTISKVELLYKPTSVPPVGSELLRWDFIEQKDYNYLVIFFENPNNKEISDFLNLRVSGTFKKL